MACLRALWGFCGCGRWEIASIIGGKKGFGRKALGNVCLCGIEHLKAWDCVGLCGIGLFFAVFGEMVTVILCYIVYLLDKYS